MNRRSFLAASLLPLAGCTRSNDRVVLYCAQDQEFAEELLADFTRETGLVVAPKYDTESNKSVSLAKELAAEASRPRCDVHWNNEILGTIRLARQGVYESYEAPNAKPFPAWSHPDDRTWQAFATRARVIVVNTKLLPNEAEWPRSLLDLTDVKWKDRLAMAKPTHGTTATHAACLFDVLGENEARGFFRLLKSNNLRILAGNKDVAVGVAAGRFAAGITDTDDALSQIREGKPLALILPDRDGNSLRPRWGTLFIPNTLAVVKNGPNPAAARRLIDFLLRPETEQRLAERGGFQIPLNPTVISSLPKELSARSEVKPMAVDWDHAVDLWETTQKYVQNQFS